MKARVLNWIIRGLQWAWSRLEPTGVVLVIPRDAALERAIALVAQWETNLGDGYGEARRHQVYARLITEFPALSKRDLALRIEAALQ